MPLRSVVDLQAAINRFLAETNAEPKPFTWTADPDKSSPPSDEGTKRIPSTSSRRAPSITLRRHRRPKDDREKAYEKYCRYNTRGKGRPLLALSIFTQVNSEPAVTVSKKARCPHISVSLRADALT